MTSCSMILFEFSIDDYPEERLVACRNPELAEHRKKTRNDLLEVTKKELEKVKKMVTAGRLKGEDKIGLRTGKVINKFKMAKHFQLKIEEGKLEYTVDSESVQKEAQLDGIYVIRYSTRSKDPLQGEEAVRHYKSLTKVERAFRSIKTTDLEDRPIRHYTESRVKTHLFICMLAYYVKWHMMEAWRPLLFADEELKASMAEKGYVFSSANSINIGRLIPQVVYYFYAYCQLLKKGTVEIEEAINISVPTGNFGNILAAYYAKSMGLPVNKLICASNDNKVLYYFFATGTYDRNRDFILTISPSMDISIS